MRRFRAAVLFNKIILGGLIVRLLLLLALQSAGYSFVLMGPPDTGETFPGGIDANYQDEYGGPKNRGRFFRWTIPDFTYAFDASFVNYFGIEGMESVNDAVTVINDFFVNEAYEGVSRLDLAKHGFKGNHNTYWVNTSARNAQILDLKSMVLGMLVNHLGLGNPHRHAFTITDVNTNTSSTALNFQVQLRNYDPQSFETTDDINGVQYSYRLIHDAPIGLGSPLPTINVADMEEFTTDTSGNAWTAVAGITDALYGSTSLFWTDVPTLFSFGGYFDGRNSMGGQYRPRHALTYDDAGGLKYLYKTNNYAYEDLFNNALIGGAPVILENPQFLPSSLAVYFPNQTGRRFPFFPRRAGGNNIAFPYTSSLRGMPIPGFNNANLTATNAGPAGIAMRGGIDKIQFHHQPFDSLLGVQYTPTNFIWTDIFVSPSKSAVGNLKNTTPGASVYLMPSPRDFFFQKVGRQVSQPDILFYAEHLGKAADGVPIAWDRNVPDYMDNAPLHLGFATNVLGNEVGPGTLELPALFGSSFYFSFAKFDQNFEVLWSGESSVVGNMEEMPSLWGYIKGPGPNDFIGFPKGSTQDRVWNSVIPDTAAPVISLVSDNGGEQPIEQNTFTRTEETLTIIGTEMASVKAIEVMINDLVIQTIMPVDKYIVSNSRIDIPAGVLTEEAEGTLRQIRVQNNVGASVASEQKFTIETGRPVITSTTYDNFIFDRAQTLTVSGYGFKSKTVGETLVTQIRVDDATTGSSVENNGTQGTTGISNGLPYPAANIQTISDTQIVLPIDAITSRSDGSNRRLRVARRDPASGLASDVDSVLSPATNPIFTAITAKPIVSTLSQLDGDLSATWESVLTTTMFKRDKILEINGTALNTVSTIEITQEDGTSFANPVFIQLPNPGIHVEDNGTRILVAADAIPWADADSNKTAKRAFKLYNAVANTDLVAAQTFSVNTQPILEAISLLDSTGQVSLGTLADGSTALVYVRDQDLGGPVTFFGSGLKAVGEIRLAKLDGTDVNATNPVRITLPSPGVTVTDTQIAIDSTIAQFGNGASADSNKTSDWRRFQLLSARDLALSSQTQRFYVGPPPVYSNLAGLTPGSLHYRRDSDVMTFLGENLSMMTRVEIVDKDGNTIPGAPALLPSNLNIIDDTRFSINANTFQNPWFLDSVAMDRRLKVITPFGATISNLDENGSFTVTATPKFEGFTGGGYDPGSGTFDASKGPIIIRGENFRGMSKLEFGDAGSGVHLSLDFNPRDPPDGIVINERGTEIHIDPKFFAKRDETWLRSGGSSARTISMSTPTKQKKKSPPIKTKDRQSRILLNNTHPPTITAHPPDASVDEGNSTTLSVAATGATGYQWYKGTAAINGATGTSYTNANFETGHQGSYRAAAINAGGRTLSAEATLTMTAPGGGGGGGGAPAVAPLFTLHPVSQAVAVAGSVTFNTSVNGTAPLSYQWKKNGVNINGATASNLTLSNVQPAEIGLYNVQVSNSAGNAKSSNAELHVKLPSTTTFGYDFFDDGSRNTALWGTVDFQTSAARFLEQSGNLTYYTTGTPAGEQFAYRPWRAGALSYDNNWTAEVDLQVDDDIVLGLNSDIEFGLYVFNQNDPDDYAWLTLMHERSGAGVYSDTYGVLGAVDGNESIPGINTSINRTQDEADIRIFWDAGNQIMYFQKDDTNSGIWTTVQSLTIKAGGNLDWGMVAGAKFGLHLYGSSNNQAITIGDGVIFDEFEIASTPPVIVAPLTNQSMPAGNAATFTVTANEASRYFWTGPNGPIGGADNATLTLTNVQPAHAGSYTVFVSNAMGTVSSSATLTLSSAPTFTAQPTGQVVTAGGSVTLNGTATGATSYQWYRNRTAIPGATGATHTIANFSDAAHAGRYEVYATNAQGTSTSMEAHLHERITTIGGSGSDNFDDNLTDLAKWVANDFSRDGNFTETNGTLAYSAPNGGDVSVTRVWKANAMPSDSNWTAMVDVNLINYNLSGSEVLEIGMGISHQHNMDKGATLTLERNSTHSYFHAETYVTGGEDSNKTLTNSTYAGLRMRWDAGNTILYAEFDDNASDINATWQVLDSWNLSAGLTNWDLNSTSSFVIDLSADSEGLTVANNWNIFMDNFSVGQFNHGLIIYYPFIGNANDESGNGNHGTVHGATETTDSVGEAGKAYRFDGVNDEMKIPSTSGIEVLENFTCSFWGNPERTTRRPSESISGNGMYGGTSNSAVLETMAMTTSTYAGCGISLGTDGFVVYEHADGHMPATLVYSADLTGWKHYTVVIENNRARLYINGIQVRQGLQSARKLYFAKNFGGWDIGEIADAVYGRYNGKLDEFRVYNRTLSAVEVSELHALEKPTLNDGLVAYYPFNGNANDESGNGNNGATEGGPVLMADRFGNANSAYKFLGVDERIVVPLQPGAKKAYTALTVSAWVKLETNSHANYIQILEFYNPNYAGNYVRTLELKAMGPIYGADQGKLRFGLRNSSNAAVGVNTPSALPLNTLHHVTGVFDGSQVKLYLDGVLVASEAGSVTQTGIPQTLYIGKLNMAQWGSQAYSWKGPLDDIRIYGRALSAAEVSQLYQLEKP